MSERAAESDTARKHHPDCPAPYFTSHPDRCRCMFLAALEDTEKTP